MNKTGFIPGIGLILLLVFSACEVVHEVAEIIQPKTAREKYLKELSLNNATDSLVFDLWQEAWDSTFNQAWEASTAYQEKGFIQPLEYIATSYTFDLEFGEQLFFEFKKDSANLPVFFELLHNYGDTIDYWEPITSNGIDKYNLIYEAERTGQYLLRWQAPPNEFSAYELKLWKTPVYAFPVRGKGNEDVWSFFGDSRDGGRRKHKGIDIFAKRGTPLIAITDGIVINVSDQGLGGKQVWLRDLERGNSLYYAHLDSQLVTAGQYVSVGDTIGLVGNTGNAKRTRPHLHFGIYKRGRGAVDPLPFVYKRQPKFKDHKIALEPTHQTAITKIRSTNLRVAPTNKSEVITKLKKGVKLQLEALAGAWFRVETDGGQQGFVYNTSVKLDEGTSLSLITE